MSAGDKNYGVGWDTGPTYTWSDGSVHTTPQPTQSTTPTTTVTTPVSNPTPVASTPTTNSTPTTTPTTPQTPTLGETDLQQIVPYKPQTQPLTQQEWLAANPGKTEADYNTYVSGFNPQTGLMNVADYAGQVVLNPELALTSDSQLSTQVPQFSQADIDAGIVNQQPGMSGLQAQTAQVGSTATMQNVNPQQAVGYNAAQSQQEVANNQMTAAQGTLSNGSIIDINGLQIDLTATAEGTNAVGAALKDFAYLDPNDVDSRATLVGQMELLQSQFFDDQGNPVIPAWASGIARDVQKIAAFKGITGTAATAAMSNALLEGTVQIAKQDASFFQTLTLQNLDNKQKSIIQRAATLANMELANLDSRTTAAVQNSKAFLEMDMANLNNEQQSRVINNQARIQSILTDTNAENASRLFLATNQNDLNKFYDQLNASIEQYNSSQINGMNQFNVGQTNSMAQFNASLEDSRDKFYRTMSYNIDVANAQWRQTIATTENQQQFEAAALDVKNKVAITQEELNKLWDRADALLDYVWKSGENELDRNSALVIAKVQADTSKTIASIQADVANSNKPGILDVLGSIAGTLLGKLF